MLTRAILMPSLFTGQNQFIESICKKLFSIDDVLSILVENKDLSIAKVGGIETTSRKRKTFQAYLRVLHDVYLSENCLLRLQTNTPIGGDPRIWEVVETISTELHLFATGHEQGYLKRSDVPYVLKMLKFLYAFWSRHFRPDSLPSEMAGDGEGNLVAEEEAMGFEDDNVSLNSAADDDLVGNSNVFTKSHAESVNQEFAPKIATAVATIAFANGGRERWVQGERLARKLVMVILQNTRNFKTAEEWRATTTAISSIGPLQGLAEEQLVNLDVESLREIHFASRAARRAVVTAVSKGRKQSSVTFEGTDALQSETQTVAFRSFVVSLKFMYWNKNDNYHECHKKGIGTGGKARNPECFYLQEGDDDDDESILPCGAEYQQLLNIFLTRNGKASDHGFKALLRYLGFLQQYIFEDVGATDNEREDAEKQVVTTLKLLSAMMMRYRCDAFCGKDYIDEQTEVRRELNAQMHLMQTKMALSGAAEHCINLIANEEDDVMKAAFRYFMMILLDGNVQVQELAILAFNSESQSSGALARLREELVRGIAALRQLRQAQYRAETVSAVSMGRDGLFGSVQGSMHGSMRGSMSSKDPIDFKDIDLIKLSLKAVGSRSSISDMDEDRDINDDEFRWVLSVAGGIQLMAEGQFKPIQDYLREQKSSKGQSVNFVAELCKALQQVFMNIGQGEQWQREQWLILIDQLLDAITELCQGNQTNQQEARDEQIIKMVNAIVAYDTATESDLEAC